MRTASNQAFNYKFDVATSSHGTPIDATEHRNDTIRVTIAEHAIEPLMMIGGDVLRLAFAGQACNMRTQIAQRP